ncbi:MAG: Ig-like domain-containing protein [Lachnospiraceae bacterium]|nr:Ig-like domain-containing protein [Lachnospiraceae bacterium]
MSKFKKILVVLLAFVMTLSLMPVQAEAAKKVKLNKKTLSLKVGKSYTLKLKNAKSKNVKWSSSKKSVATVSQKGKVKAKKKGSCKITAKYENKKYVCKVTVKKAYTDDGSSWDDSSDDSSSDTQTTQEKYSVKIEDLLGVDGSYDKIQFKVTNNGTSKIRIGDMGDTITYVSIYNALAGSVLVQSSKNGYGNVTSCDLQPGESKIISITYLFSSMGGSSYYKTFHLCKASYYEIKIYDYAEGKLHTETCYPE